MPISTRDLSGLPDVNGLKRLLQSMAVLDAILSPEWEYRYYSFNARWSKVETVGSMRNGLGDDFHALFTRHGCFLKGFAHEAPMTPYARKSKGVWPGVLDSVPAEFAAAVTEPAFCMEDTTFSIWRKAGDDRWHRGKIAFPKGAADPDGSESLLSPLDGKPETYLQWAADYFSAGEKLTLDHVRHVYAHEPLTAGLVKAINPALSLVDLAEDMAEIGYPKGSGKR